MDPKLKRAKRTYAVILAITILAALIGAAVFKSSPKNPDIAWNLQSPERVYFAQFAQQAKQDFQPSFTKAPGSFILHVTYESVKPRKQVATDYLDWLRKKHPGRIFRIEEKTDINGEKTVVTCRTSSYNKGIKSEAYVVIRDANAKTSYIPHPKSKTVIFIQELYNDSPQIRTLLAKNGWM